MTWDNPHWSGRPQQSAGPRQKLRPNAYARLARFSAAHGSIIVLLYAVLAMVCGSYAASVLRIDPDQRPRITLDEATARLQAELGRQFPGIEQTFLAIIGQWRSPEPRASRPWRSPPALSAARGPVPLGLRAGHRRILRGQCPAVPRSGGCARTGRRPHPDGAPALCHGLRARHSGLCQPRQRDRKGGGAGPLAAWPGGDAAGGLGGHRGGGEGNAAARGLGGPRRA